MDNQNNQVSSELIEKPEDAALETEALAEPKADAIRQKLIEDLGIADSEENADVIEKLVTSKLEDQKKLQTAIKQKISWREKAKKPPEQPTEERPITIKSKEPVEDVSKLVEQKLNERLDDEKLEEIEISEQSKDDLKAYAKSKGITVRQALKSEYFTFLQEGEKKKNREDNASISSSAKASAKTTYSADKPPQVDMTTPEGQAEWDKYVTWLSSQ